MDQRALPGKQRRSRTRSRTVTIEERKRFLEVRGKGFEENLALDRSFLLPLNRSEVPPIVLVLVLEFSWVGAKISKIERPRPPFHVLRWGRATRRQAIPHSESVAPIAMPVISSTIVAVTIIAVAVVAAAVVAVIAVPPVGSVIPPVIRISRIVTVVGIGVVIARSVEGRDRNGKSKGKVNTGTCGRFREERQSSDRKNKDNELLHMKRDEQNVPRIQEIVRASPQRATRLSSPKSRRSGLRVIFAG